MTKPRKKTKLAVKKREIRRIDREALEKARGGTASDASVDYCVIDPYTNDCELDPPSGNWTLRQTGGWPNHNQRLSR